ncbi:serine hydroxymethyltransferase, partial [bacterium]|nr:serine hydroxymethyltransferase [bacterium]
NITCNKNMIPFDPRTPFNPSGIRLGTPALTTRGMKEEQMKQVGRFIAEVIDNVNDESVYARVKGKVGELCEAFPLYEDL